MNTASSKCPCGKTHTRLPDGSIGDVPAVPSPLGEWMGRLPPLSDPQRRHEWDPSLPGRWRVEDGALNWEPLPVEGQRRREYEQQVHYAIGDQHYMAWDATPLREAELRRLYANIPVPGRWYRPPRA